MIFPDQAEFEVENTRELRGKTAPVYCGLEEGAQGLFVASEADLVIISDSLYPVKTEVNDETEKEEEGKRCHVCTYRICWR